MGKSKFVCVTQVLAAPNDKIQSADGLIALAHREGVKAFCKAQLQILIHRHFLAERAAKTVQKRCQEPRVAKAGIDPLCHQNQKASGIRGGHLELLQIIGNSLHEGDALINAPEPQSCRQLIDCLLCQSQRILPQSGWVKSVDGWDRSGAPDVKNNR